MRSIRLLCAMTWCAVPLTAAAQPTSRRPNILVCIADDWSFPHAGAYGNKAARTPTFNRLASEGAVFTNAYCAAPSCTPSRGAILTGQAPHRLAEGGDLWGTLPARFAVYPDLLEESGYVVGHTRKGWGPGLIEPGGRTRNPAGPHFKDFRTFLETVPADRPFCFWFGSYDPHRPYEEGSGRAAGFDPAHVKVPPFLPDVPEVRSDLCDYYREVQRFDREVGELLGALEEAGRSSETIVVMTSDNGLPFPRAKANLYDAGTRMPLAIRWPGIVQAGRRLDTFVSLADLAPTFLEGAGVAIPAEMTGKSLVGLLKGETSVHRDCVYLERERHAYVRAGLAGYPMRAVRTDEFLYIRNWLPDRWPAGDPFLPVKNMTYGDIDGSPTKAFILEHKNEPDFRRFFELACAKRPAEELYVLSRDPNQMINLAEQAAYAEIKKSLSEQLAQWMTRTNDPRASGGGDLFDRYPYYGQGEPKPKQSRKPKAGQ